MRSPSPAVRGRASGHRKRHDHDRYGRARALRPVADVSEPCGEGCGPDTVPTSASAGWARRIRRRAGPPQRPGQRFRQRRRVREGDQNLAPGLRSRRCPAVLGLWGDLEPITDAEPHGRDDICAEREAAQDRAVPRAARRERDHRRRGGERTPAPRGMATQRKQGEAGVGRECQSGQEHDRRRARAPGSPRARRARPGGSPRQRGRRCGRTSASEAESRGAGGMEPRIDRRAGARRVRAPTEGVSGSAGFGDRIRGRRRSGLQGVRKVGTEGLATAGVGRSGERSGRGCAGRRVPPAHAL